MATLAAAKPENLIPPTPSTTAATAGENNSSNNDNKKKSNEILQPHIAKSLLEGNGFNIIRKIGTGSYSKVKLAYSKNHKAMVAIKIVSKYHVPEEFLRKFLYNEIKVVKFLKHENIIKYYQSIETSHRLYVIMQHAENGSILDLIHKLSRVSEPRACHLFRQIISAIQYCHAQGVAHRDIKCENILLDENFTVKVIDFGFSKCYKNCPRTAGEEKLDAMFEKKESIVAVAAKTTSSGGGVKKKTKNDNAKLSETYCGSYAYASPEILRGIPYDPFLSDVWAMGCVLFAMVYGRLPFDDRDPSKLIRQVQSPLHFPQSIDTSENVKTCLKKMLAQIKVRISVDNLNEDQWIKTAHHGYNST